VREERWTPLSTRKNILVPGPYRLPDIVANVLRRNRARPPVLDPLDALSAEEFVDLAYRMVLGREPDPLGRKARLAELKQGRLDRAGVLSSLRTSPEMRGLVDSVGSAIHLSRRMFVRSLPRANSILDLGGVDLDDPRGGLVSLGYPYRFDSLTVVDLPNELRHEIYRSSERAECFVSDHGPIHYRYHSMEDLSLYADSSVDLIYSGQSIEHITRPAGEQLLAEVGRVLAPGGCFALDTPNRVATEIELMGSDRQFVDPDHEIEYRSTELEEMFDSTGLCVLRRHGLNWLPGMCERGSLSAEEIAAEPGIFDEADECYILAYVVGVE